MAKGTAPSQDQQKVSEKGKKGNASDRLDPASRGSSGQGAEVAKGPLGFFISTRQELDKVVWPNRRQLISESVAVLLIVLAFASFVYLIDQAFGWAAQQIFG